MSLLNIAIPNLLNGVSQQPASLRFPTQCEAQENGYSSVVDGLGKRSPTEHVAKLVSGAAGNVKVHTIDRGDGTERYVVLISDSSIRVFDMNTGAEKTVATPNGQTYLDIGATDSPHQCFKAVSIADYTFIVNTKQTVALDTATTTAAANEALVWVKQGAYSTRYQISGTFSASVDTESNVFSSAQTYDGETFPASSSPADTICIAARLKAGITGGTTPTITRSGYSIHLTQTAAFNITIKDGAGGSALGLIKGSTQSFSDLPTVATNGMVVKIEGLPEETADDYYVKFTSKNGTSMGEGTWAEAVGPGIKYRYNYATMPYVLIRLPAGSGYDFVFKQANGTAYSGITGTDARWSDRVAGDDSSNPQPSFVGSTITDIFMFRGRLGILSGENVILSEAGQYFNFWRTSVTKLLDGDPIDISSSHPQITLFRHAAPFSERLVLFADRVQFVLGSKQAILTASNVYMTPVANYDVLQNCRPVVLGDGVFFGFDRGSYCGVREMQANPNDSSLLTAPDVSAHIPKYIPGKFLEIAGSTHDNILVGLADGEQSSLFVYKWFDSSQDRVQSAWSKWTFNGATVRGMAWLQSTLFVVLQRTEGLFLEKITVEPNRKDTYSKFVTSLDRRVGLASGSGSYNSATGQTTFTLPYNVQNPTKMAIVLQATASSEAGYLLDIASTGVNTVVVNGDWSTKAVWAGEQYTMSYQFSQPYMKQSDGRSQVTLASGRFQVRNMQLIFTGSSCFKAQVSHKFSGTAYEYLWDGNILGTGQSIIGNVPVESGTFRFPVYGKNDEMIVALQNDTHLPSYFLSAEIEASYDSRSKRI